MHIGISNSDLKHAGWNFIAFGTLSVSSGLIAWEVSRLVYRMYFYFHPPSFSELDTADKNTRKLAFGACMVGASNFILTKLSIISFDSIHNYSMNKTLELGAILAILCAVEDLRRKSFPLMTAFGVTIAIICHWNDYLLTAFDMTGAGAVNKQ